MASYKSFSWSAILTLCHLLISFMLLSFDGAMRECGAATFTFKNQCGYTVWPGILSNAGSPLLGNGGFKLESGQSASLEAPEGWSGRVWGRTGCSFAIAGTSGGVCVTGDCAGRLQCSGAGAETPATLAEFTLASGGAGNDFYDVSLVDGFNLPIAIIPTGIETGSRTDASAATNHCGIAGCAADLNRICPAALQLLAAAMAMGEQDIAIDRDLGAVNSNNVVVGCKSACDAFGDPRFCCSGAYANPSTCSPSSYAQIFKSACPAAYSYAFDDPTSTFTCNSGAHYSIVYCPSSSSTTSSSQRSGQSSLVGTQAYASEMSTSAPSTSAPARRLLHLAVHVILLLALARAC